MEGPNEAFLKKWLTNDNGTLATYIQDSNREDEDLVAGRETLSETVGLWMFYALEIEDRKLFDHIYKLLHEYYLESNGFIHWKLTEKGDSKVSTNALIDDIRISDALLHAHEIWGGENYVDTADTINTYLSANNVNNGIFTNFYDREIDYASSEITLSYIDVQAFSRMIEQGHLDKGIVKNTISVLTEAPLTNGFYPMSYNVETDKYSFDDEINMIDQAITAYHYAEAGNRSEEFLYFIQKEMKERGLVNGMYSLETKSPVVDYESPAVYGFLILYLLEIDENETAIEVFERMKEFQITDSSSQYYGGYSITDGDTHIFDNLIPFIAEELMDNQNETVIRY